MFLILPWLFLCPPLLQGCIKGQLHWLHYVFSVGYSCLSFGSSKTTQWSHWSLGQREERKKQARWLGQKEKSNPYSAAWGLRKPGCSPSQAVCWNRCLNGNRKRKEKQFFILKEWETDKHEAEPALKHCGAFLYQASSILPQTTSWQFSSLINWSTLNELSQPQNEALSLCTQ